MVIRDDRGCDRKGTPVRPTEGMLNAERDYWSPDRVLYDCPECGRAHFVTVGGCPSESQAAREVAAVDGKAA